MLIIYNSSDCQELSIPLHRPHGGKPAERARGCGGERASDSSAGTTDSSGDGAKPRPGRAGATARGGVLAAGAAVLSGGERGRATGRATQGGTHRGQRKLYPGITVPGIKKRAGRVYKSIRVYTNVLGAILL